MKKSKLAVAGLLTAASILAGSMAQALTINKGYAWESLAGARWNGQINIQSSYQNSGVRQGYIRFMREAGPALDTGRIYTSRSRSASDTQIYTAKKTVWDSVLWGDRYTTKFYWGTSR